MNITTNQRRFLVIWALAHTVILFINIAKIDNKINQNDTNGRENQIYPLTNSTFNDRFWPFTVYNQYTIRVDTIKKRYPFVETEEVIIHRYNGIFNSYDITEYGFYLLLGLGAVYVPKLWLIKS